MSTPEHPVQPRVAPRSIWETLYLVWFVICFVMVLFGTWAVNRPVSVMGLPLVYVWCTGWGFVWLIGCLIFGLKIEREQEEERGA